MNSIANDSVQELGEVAQSAFSQPTAEERWALIQRIATSEYFHRAGRLRNFLLYVGRHSLAPNSPEIHEEEIGTNVFGRPENYDRGQDNIVRVNASELRKRIETYFVSPAGAQESLILEIPRGGYTPIYRYRASSSPGELSLPQEKQTQKSNPKRFTVRIHGAWLFLGLAVILFLIVCCLALLHQNHNLLGTLEPWQDKPAVAVFWKGFLASQRPTDIVLPDDSVSVAEEMTGVPITLSDYDNLNFIHRLSTLPLSEDRRTDVSRLYNHNLVTFGSIRAGLLIQAQIPPHNSRNFVWARFYSVDEIKQNNVVLVGGKKSNPWNQLFDNQINFITDCDDTCAHGFIRNRHPGSHEQAIYDPNEVSGVPDSFASYSAVAYLPNPSGTGHVLILAGIDSESTAAAAEFLSSEKQMEQLQSVLHAGNFFPSFEALLRVSRVNGTSFHAELLAYRIYPNLH